MMKIVKKQVVACSFAIAIGGLALPISLFAECIPQYDLVELSPHTPNAQSLGKAISPSGTISSLDNGKAALHRGDVIRLLSMSASLRSVQDTGFAVGESGYGAVAYSPATDFIDLHSILVHDLNRPDFDINMSEARNTNSEGQIVGRVFDYAANKTRAFIYDQERGAQFIRTGTYTTVLAHKINDNGVAIGIGHNNNTYSNFLYDSKLDSLQILPELCPSHHSGVSDINNANKVVGQVKCVGDSAYTAFVYDSEKGIREFPAPGQGTGLLLWAINDNGEVVASTPNGLTLYLPNGQSFRLADITQYDSQKWNGTFGTTVSLAENGNIVASALNLQAGVVQAVKLRRLSNCD